MRSTFLFLLACFLGAGAACGGDEGSPDAAPDATVDTGASDTAPDTTPPVDAGTPDGDATLAPGDICDELALSRQDMLEGTGDGYGDVAGDFVVDTLSGESFRLSEQWSGCESYVFINYADVGFAQTLWRSFADPIPQNSARNVHYFFTSYEGDAATVRTRMVAQQENFEEAYGAMSAEEADFWRERVHFVTTPLLDIEGSVGERARNQAGIHFVFGIGRDQRFDQVGSLSQVSGGGFVPRLGMTAYAGHYYNYRAALRERLAAEAAEADVVIVPLMANETVTERVLDRTVELPDAAAMAGFDSLEFDVQLTCHLEAGDCSEWDRIAYIHLCTDATCETRLELVRWITPYSRPGRRRWVIDATPFLGLLQDGGPQTFRVTTGPGWERATERDVNIELRLRDAALGDASSGVELAFRGGNFDASYNAAKTPFAFTPPAGTTRVELVTIISGHGQTGGDNCAEWCNHEHDFAVNGETPHHISFDGEAGQALGCAERAVDGAIPGQWGNWAPLRAGWCPGLPVPARRVDITSEVDLSAENSVTYQASFAGGEPRGGNMELSTYVVYYQ